MGGGVAEGGPSQGVQEQDAPQEGQYWFVDGGGAEGGPSQGV